jgi:hypothetical protein
MLATLLLAGSATILGPASAGPMCAAPWQIYDFDIETKWSSKVMRVGDSVRVTLTVTRPDDQDPTGNGLPWAKPTSEPVEGARAATTAYFPNTYIWDQGVTDKKGKVTLTLRVPEGTRPGKSYASSSAYIPYNEGKDCASAEERGYARDDDLAVRP